MKNLSFVYMLIVIFSLSSCAALNNMMNPEPATKEIEKPTHKKVETKPNTMTKSVSPTDINGLVQVLGLNGNTEADFRSKMIQFNKLRSKVAQTSTSSDEKTAGLAKVMKDQNAAMKTLLSATQFDKYMSIVEKAGSRSSGGLKVGGGE